MDAWQQTHAGSPHSPWRFFTPNADGFAPSPTPPQALLCALAPRSELSEDDALASLRALAEALREPPPPLAAAAFRGHPGLRSLLRCTAALASACSAFWALDALDALAQLARSAPDLRLQGRGLCLGAA